MALKEVREAERIDVHLILCASGLMVTGRERRKAESEGGRKRIEQEGQGGEGKEEKRGKTGGGNGEGVSMRRRTEHEERLVPSEQHTNYNFLQNQFSFFIPLSHFQNSPRIHSARSEARRFGWNSMKTAGNVKEKQSIKTIKTINNKRTLVRNDAEPHHRGSLWWKPLFYSKQI